MGQNSKRYLGCLLAKTWLTLTFFRVSRFVQPSERCHSPQVAELCEGHFVERAVNVLAFGLPGRGKTHFLSAVGYELIQRHSKRVLFIPSFKLIQRLLEAKRELKLEVLLKKLDGYAAIILDDLGYVQQTREEMEVLFTFLAERCQPEPTAPRLARLRVPGSWCGAPGR